MHDTAIHDQDATKGAGSDGQMVFLRGRDRRTKNQKEESDFIIRNLSLVASNTKFCELKLPSIS
jgi:hypothetical protein